LKQNQSENVRVYGQRFTVIGVLKKQGAFLKAMILSFYSNFLRQLYGDNNESLVNRFKPNKGVDMGAYKAEIAKN
jgi:putative ABC transport system permease protein